MSLNELKEKLEEEKKKLLDNSPVKKGDLVEYKGKKGTVSYVYVDDKNFELVIRIALSRWNNLNFSNRNIYVKDNDIQDIKKIKNPFDKTKLEKLEYLKEQIEDELVEKTKLLRAQKERVEKYIKCTYDTCIHNFEKDMFDKPIRTEIDRFGTIHNYYKYVCSYCGLEIEEK